MIHKYISLHLLVIYTGMLLTESLMATNSAEIWIKSFGVAEGLKVKAFASDNQLANPVALTVTPDGSVFVSESLRQGKGVSGVARKPFLANQDFKIKNLNDRHKLYQDNKHQLPIKEWSRYSEQIRQLKDTNKDQKADSSKIIAKGFNDILDGAAAGVIERDGDLYFTCSPHLWRLRDLDQDGIYEKREAIITGLGIRIGIHGHDLHAPLWGPDGKLYFNLGDRGYDIITKEGKHLHAPQRGGVFRCEPDGTNLELFHTGVRNPQGMAFDELGNLFTVDNDMGAGDKARILYLQEGADSGWYATNQLFRNFRKQINRQKHAILPPWMTEGLWKTQFNDQPLWVNPAIAYLTKGPSGMAYHPGVGFNQNYKNHFFICDYQGSASRSQIFAFSLLPHGAGFKMNPSKKILSHCLATDVSFGFDGKLYLSDWIGGSNGKGLGRIYTLESTQQTHPNYGLDYSNIKSLKKSQLIVGLRHDDLRIRQRCQFEAAKRNNSELLLKLAFSDTKISKRLNGIWGIGQIAKKKPFILEKLLPLFDSSKSEIKAQVSKVMGDHQYQPARQALIQQLNDPLLRNQSMAALALGKLKNQADLNNILNSLNDEKMNDPFYRQAVSKALTYFDLTEQEVNPKNSSIDLATLLAMRMKQHPHITKYLSSPHLPITYEAIRAIHDLEFPEQLPTLAQYKKQDPNHFLSLPLPLQLRVINANFRLGKIKHAQRILNIARQDNLPTALREEAIYALNQWLSPSEFDRITWMHRPLNLETREDYSTKFTHLLQKQPLTTEIKELKELFSSFNQKFTKDSQVLIKTIHSKNHSLTERLKAFQLLQQQDNKISHTNLLNWIKTTPTQLKQHVLLEIVKRELPELENCLIQFYHDYSLSDTPLIIPVLKDLNYPVIINQLVQTLQKMDQTNPKYHFELIEAARQHPSSKVQQAYEHRLKLKYKSSKFSKWQHTLTLGDPIKGKHLFSNSVAQCSRCHIIGKTGGLAGPDLSHIGNKFNTEQLLEAILDPNASIAEGYGNISITMKNGQSQVGTFIKSTNTTITLRQHDHSTLKLEKSQIENQSEPISGMPPMQHLLQPREIRDLLAYLSLCR